MIAPDILSAEYAENPYPFYKVMRDHYPLYYHEGTRCHVLSRYEDVVLACKHPAMSTRNYAVQLEPVHGYTIMQMDGREHTRYRNILNPALRGADLRQKFVPIIERTVDAIMASFHERGEVDLVKEFTAVFPIQVMAEMLGIPKKEIPLYQEWYTLVIDYFKNFSGDPEIVKRGERTRRDMRAFMLPIIQERRAHPGNDLLSTLCTANIDGMCMDDEQICAFVSLLITAGGETTDKALSLMVRNLIDHPEQMEKVRDHRELIERALVETLRYNAPAQMLTRLSLEDVEFSGGTIPAGSMVICLMGSANRDERQFKDPDRFNIFRDDLDIAHAFSRAANHMAFGMGTHFCIGSLLAKVEVTIAANRLLDAMQDIRYKDAPPVERGIAMRGFTSMPLVFEPAPRAYARRAVGSR